MDNIDYIFKRLKQSKFRSRFKLSGDDLGYIGKIGMKKIGSHTRDFIEKRLAPAEIPNDGRQTPFKGHPVFKAQHATATCCRGCLAKWHKISKDTELDPVHKKYCCDIIMRWIVEEIKKHE